MSATNRQEKDFKSAMGISDTLLDEAIVWIAENMDPDDVFEDEEKLHAWATKNGYVIPED